MTLSNFNFKFNGHGHYLVTYTSPTGRLVKSAIIDDMTIIDKTKNQDNPTRRSLEFLRKRVFNN